MKSKDLNDVLKGIKPGTRFQLKMKPGGMSRHFITEDARRGIDEVIKRLAFGELTTKNPKTRRTLEKTTQHGHWDDHPSRMFVVITTEKFDPKRFVDEVGPHLEWAKIVA